MNTLFAERADSMTNPVAQITEASGAVAKIESLNWPQITSELNDQGSSLLKNVLTVEECVALSSLYPNEDGFRSRVVMGRHGFGRSLTRQRFTRSFAHDDARERFA